MSLFTGVVRTAFSFSVDKVVTIADTTPGVQSGFLIQTDANADLGFWEIYMETASAALGLDVVGDSAQVGFGTTSFGSAGSSASGTWQAVGSVTGATPDPPVFTCLEPRYWDSPS